MKSIEEFYLPRHLVKAIYEIGHIPDDSREAKVGVGFIDIADYTHLSKFLSPKENQILLNGLYTAFLIVLERHGGFLNKTEGDSMMFQFDDVLDRKIGNLPDKERIAYIARELFYTCVEMQRVCVLFNQADVGFLEDAKTDDSKIALSMAFEIMRTLRSKTEISSTLSAFFQIRIRIGANLGDVTIGNFGPSGEKHWDIIGTPVINAKRMESTAPVGGLRISAEFFEILKSTGIADDYFISFRKEAAKLGSVYKDISWEELYRFREVTLYQKKSASYRTYSVQVYPALPESLCRQSSELLNHGQQGVNMILENFRYYRANRLVIDQMEELMATRGIVFRKDKIMALISPNQSANIQNAFSFSLWRILDYLDQYLDYVQEMPDEESKPEFYSYDQFMTTMHERIRTLYDNQKKMILKKMYFTEVIVQQVYASFEASLREYQLRMEEPEEAEEEL